MEHIIQIAVSVDDNRIAELAEQAAARELVKKFIKENDGYGPRRWTNKLSEMAVEAIASEMAQEGYDGIAEAVAGKLARSPKFREKVAAALAERGN